MLLDSTAIHEKFTKDVIIIGAAHAVLNLRGLILLPLISKLLGAADYGIWVQVYVTLSLVSTFASLGIGFAFIRFFAGVSDKGKIREGFFSILITLFGWSCLIALAFYFFGAPLAETFLGGLEATNIAKLCAIILPFYVVNSHFFFFFRTFRKMKTYALLLLAQSFSEVGIVAAFVLMGWGIFGAVLAILITYALSGLVMFLIIAKQIGLSRIPLTSFAKIKDYLRFGLPLLPSNLASWIVNLSDRYVIAAFVGIAFTGIYSAAYNLGNIILMYMGPLSTVLVPTLVYLYDNNRVQDVKTQLTYSLKYFLLLAIPSAAGLSLLARPVLHMLATPEFATFGSIVVPIIVIGILIQGCSGIISQIIILVKRTHILGIASGIAAALNLGLNLLLVPRFGIVAAAITTLIAFATSISIIAYVSSKHLKFDIHWAFILKSLLATAVMSVIVWLFNAGTVAEVVLAVVIGAVVYFGMIYLLRGISKEEITFFRRLAASFTPFGRSKVTKELSSRENE